MRTSDDRLVDLLNELVALPKEVEWAEFKESNWDPHKTGEIISGLSNSANLHNKPFGYLVFGLNDSNHALVGTSFKPTQTKMGNEDIEHWWQQRLDPRINVYIHEFSVSGKEVVIFEVQAAIDRPVRFSHESYIRIGGINRNLRDFPEKEKIIWNNPLRKSFEKEVAMAGATEEQVLETLDYPGYFDLIKQPLPLNKEALLLKLEQDKLIFKTKGRYDILNLGALLLAKDVRHFESVKRKTIRVVIYKGKNRITTLKEQDGAKGYAIGFPGLINYINDQLPSNEEIKAALRLEKKMYPEIAIRELVANALIHQDFSIAGSGPLIEIFEDRIEIGNPGYPLVNIERIIDSSPISRNEHLASFMRLINICEERGSGIDKAIFEVELFQLPPPKFEKTENSTKVILYGYRPLNKMSREEVIRACYQHCCLKYVSNESMTNTSLRKRFNIADKNYATASRIISDSVKAGTIKPFNPKNRSKKDARYVPFWA
jgi:ATP-dependent DNA helicase RecG